MRYEQDDPMVHRLLGVERLPDVATVSRTLASLYTSSITLLRRFSRQRVLEQLRVFGLARVQEIKAILPRCIIEARLDSAFFNEEIVGLLDTEGVAFTIGVPYERFTEFKGVVNRPKRWRQLNERCEFFEIHWKPKRWNENYRFVFIRTCKRRQYKEPVQLDVFIPYEYGYDSKVIITNMRLSAKKVMNFHNGRGAQKGMFAEFNSQTQMDYIPTCRQAGNLVYRLSAMLTHNLNREMQMIAYEQ
jgi:hypothetical protein